MKRYGTLKRLDRVLPVLQAGGSLTYVKFSSRVHLHNSRDEFRAYVDFETFRKELIPMCDFERASGRTTYTLKAKYSREAEK